MNKQTFSGTSDKGDISEALQSAIQAAKETLKSSLVTWTMETITGESGDFVEKIAVTIVASVPKQ
jgi:hypothetical protein